MLVRTQLHTVGALTVVDEESRWRVLHIGACMQQLLHQSSVQAHRSLSLTTAARHC
jgi:hypothetical protein